MVGDFEHESDVKELSPEPLFNIIYDILHKFFPESYPEI